MTSDPEASDAEASAAIIKRLKRMGNITIRLAPDMPRRFTDSLGCATEPAASSRGTMPRLAFHRKDGAGGGLPGAKDAPQAAATGHAGPASERLQYGGIVAGRGGCGNIRSRKIASPDLAS